MRLTRCTCSSILPGGRARCNYCSDASPHGVIARAFDARGLNVDENDGDLLRNLAAELEGLIPRDSPPSGHDHAIGPPHEANGPLIPPDPPFGWPIPAHWAREIDASLIFSEPRPLTPALDPDENENNTRGSRSPSAGPSRPRDRERVSQAASPSADGLKSSCHACDKADNFENMVACEGAADDGVDHGTRWFHLSCAGFIHRKPLANGKDQFPSKLS